MEPNTLNQTLPFLLTRITNWITKKKTAQSKLYCVIYAIRTLIWFFAGVNIHVIGIASTRSPFLGTLRTNTRRKFYLKCNCRNHLKHFSVSYGELSVFIKCNNFNTKLKHFPHRYVNIWWFFSAYICMYEIGIIANERQYPTKIAGKCRPSYAHMCLVDRMMTSADDFYFCLPSPTNLRESLAVGTKIENLVNKYTFIFIITPE